MILWYQSNDLKISFDKKPDVDVRYPEPNMTKQQIEEIEAKPLILNNTVTCEINYKGVLYSFVMNAGYTWDGATIPSWAWALVGSKLDPRFLIASLIHDNLCENHKYINNDRCLSTTVFCCLLEEAGIGGFKRFLMFHSVDNFQKIYGGWN